MFQKIKNNFIFSYTLPYPCYQLPKNVPFFTSQGMCKICHLQTAVIFPESVLMNNMEISKITKKILS